MAETHRMVNPRKILVKDLNTCLTCTLCGGYFIDATTVMDCSHTFCRACVVRHFESSRMCPSCGNLVHKSKPLSKLRTDTTLQTLVYKLVPFLYNKELQRRADFYHSTSFRANSSCSDDSVLGDRTQDSEEWVFSNIGDPSLYLSPDDSVSLSVEYYTRENADLPETKLELINTNISENNNIDFAKSEPKTEGESENSELQKTSDNIASRDLTSDVIEKDSEDLANDLVHKRYLQCPAAVRMSHLQKFLRMKYALSDEHRVDIIHSGEVLPPYLSLMDVAYTFKWNRENPMRFFYLIYIPTIRSTVPEKPSPNTTSTTPPPLLPPPSVPPLKIEIPNNKEDIQSESNHTPITDNKSNKKHKEIKIKEPVKPVVDDVKKEDNNNLKISSKPKVDKTEKSLNSDIKSVQKSVKFVDKYDTVQSSNAENCVYEYAEPDKDEIKAFAERRDREWALQKYTEVHVSKKRKKSKHSKNESMHKKRKLHAEITSNEVLSNTDDSLKLKVKLSVANGHKHKHRSSSNSSSSNIAIAEPAKTQELSPKERLLQMRQVRHKHVSNTINDDKTKVNSPEHNLKMVITSEKSTEKPESARLPDKSDSKISENKTPEIFPTGKTLRSDFSNKTSLSKDICNKYVRVNLEKVPDNKIFAQKKSVLNNLTIKPTEKVETKDDSKLRNVDGKTEIIPIENKTIDKSKTSNSSNNKLSESNLSVSNKSIDNNTKISNKIPDNAKINKINSKTNAELKPNDKNKSTITETKTIDQKMNQKIDESKIVSKSVETKQNPTKTVEQPKMLPKHLTNKPVVKVNEQKSNLDESKQIENKLNNIDFKSSQSTTLVTKNFTVSKVETGVKRKLDSPEIASDKRPSLEITVINLVSRPPQTSVVQTNAIQSKPISSTQTKSTLSISPEGPPVKKIRPPPLTIPLGRIQKMTSINKSNVQKPPEKCDIFGALDLSAKPTNKTEIKTNEYRAHSASPKAKIQDQIQNMIRPKTPIKTMQELKTDLTKLEKLQFSDKRPNISNLQMLSDSAVQIRELMSKGPQISSIPNLIKKIPTPINHNSKDFLQKGQNFQGKTPNLIPKMPITKNLNTFTPKTTNFLSKNLQKLPKLNEINKGQFCRLNTGQVRTPRPAGQNQSIRNIPNPSLLVRQQNQNRINLLNNTNSLNHELNNSDATVRTKTVNPENTEIEKRPENKSSGPPPLKPIESFKK